MPKGYLGLTDRKKKKALKEHIENKDLSTLLLELKKPTTYTEQSIQVAVVKKKILRGTGKDKESLKGTENEGLLFLQSDTTLHPKDFKHTNFSQLTLFGSDSQLLEFTEKYLVHGDLKKIVTANNRGDISFLLYRFAINKVLRSVKSNLPFRSTKDLYKNLNFNGISIPENVTAYATINVDKIIHSVEEQVANPAYILSLVKVNPTELIPFISGKHDLDLEIIKSYTLNTSPPKGRFVKVVRDIFHGTDFGSANMILTFGFNTKKIKVGRSLGDGVYFAPNVDKSLQYIAPAGFSRSTDQQGIILQCDFYITSVSGAKFTDRFKTSEVAIPTDQLVYLHIKKVFWVKRFPLKVNPKVPHSGKFNIVEL